MKHLMIKALQVAGLLIAVTGCGENYQSYYTGQGNITQNTCNGGGGAVGTYDLELLFQIDGDRASFYVTRITLPGTNESPQDDRLVKMRVNALFNDQDFTTNGPQFYQDTADLEVVADGRVSAGRDVIVNFAYVLTMKQSDGSLCTVRLTASNLTRRD